MQHWTDYWKNTNALNSFAEGEQGSGYSNEIADFWTSQFKSLSKGSTLVDLGTGNGAVAVLAQLYSEANQSNFQVYGIDAADITPKKINHKDAKVKKALSKINFIPNTLIEQSNFESNSVDFYFSQFAFEYSNMEKSVQHCAQCLKSGGKITLLSHHPDSEISKDSQVGASVIHYILHESPVFLQTSLLLDIALQQTQAGQMHNWHNNPYRQQISTTIKWIFDCLIDKFNANKYESYWCKLLISKITNVITALGNSHPSQLLKQLEFTFVQLDSHRKRLEDQNEACLTSDKLQSLKEYSNKHNLDFDIQELSVEGKLLAFRIHMTK